MSRQPRIISESGMYHIIFRGINKQNIFNDEQDYKKLKGILRDVKSQMDFEIYAYCFMTNHVHILIKEKIPGEISLIMKRILIRYVMWFNGKYQRTGGLIENRYKGYAINDDRYLLEVVRYIHNNPVKAGISKNREDYMFTSYREYMDTEPYLIDKNFILSMIGMNEFIDYHNNADSDIQVLEKITDVELADLILCKYQINAKDIKSLEKTMRRGIIEDLKRFCSIRQLARVTGMSRKTITNN